MKHGNENGAEAQNSLLQKTDLNGLWKTLNCVHNGGKVFGFVQRLQRSLRPYFVVAVATGISCTGTVDQKRHEIVLLQRNQRPTPWLLRFLDDS